jgi:DnaJ-domain-containing protein 1
VASITVENGTLVYESEYDAGLVAALKAAVPATDRKWDPARKVWLVSAQHGSTLVQITDRYLGENIELPKVAADTAAIETRILEVRYIGATKDRGGGNRSAFGLVNGQWATVFPESVLRDWFGAPTRPGEETSLYAVLGIKQDADTGALKSAYRRLARQWHPDICKEPDAAEQFKRINHAYEVLKDPVTRAKYNAGLALVAAFQQQQQREAVWAEALSIYRPPLRCGLIMVEGREVLGRFVVDRILAWQDITDSYGRVLVTSWPMGAEQPMEVWQ